ncbi:MAG: sensor histidine kinase [Caloramator sp.]|nr:sensor histidine kinase [Caloramator sp.]
MDKVYKIILLFCIIIKSLEIKISYINVIPILSLVASNIYRIKFKNNIFMLMFEALLIAFLYKLEKFYIILFSYLLFDLILLNKKRVAYYLLIIILAILPKEDFIFYLLIFSLTILFANLYEESRRKQEKHLKSLDTERRLRYELENTKAKLFNALDEIEELSRIKERDRISRELHDTLGHKVTGILFQLQACQKLINKDIDKSKELLKNSIEELSNTLTLIRDTVHKLKPANIYDIEFIKKLILDFKFCTTNFKYSGDIERLDQIHYEFLINTIKEVLTNTYKYSCATELNIELTVYDVFFRLYIKDNGVGCDEIKEGMGLNSIKQRVKSLKGRIQIDGKDGFMILILIPLEGSGVFEGFDS